MNLYISPIWLLFLIVLIFLFKYKLDIKSIILSATGVHIFTFIWNKIIIGGFEPSLVTMSFLNTLVFGFLAIILYQIREEVNVCRTVKQQTTKQEGEKRMKTKKPTIEQAREILESVLLGKINEISENMRKHMLVLSLLKQGILDNEISITDYKGKDWHIELEDQEVSIYEFVNKISKKEQEVSTF